MITTTHQRTCHALPLSLSSSSLSDELKSDMIKKQKEIDETANNATRQFD